MIRVPRRRRYVSQLTLTLLWPFFRYSHARDAHVLRIVGHWHGPVLRLERRRTQRAYIGGDRRGHAALS
jgi:hypothetical protein